MTQVNGVLAQLIEVRLLSLIAGREGQLSAQTRTRQPTCREVLGPSSFRPLPQRGTCEDADVVEAGGQSPR